MWRSAFLFDGLLPSDVPLHSPFSSFASSASRGLGCPLPHASSIRCIQRSGLGKTLPFCARRYDANTGAEFERSGSWLSGNSEKQRIAVSPLPAGLKRPWWTPGSIRVCVLVCGCGCGCACVRACSPLCAKQKACVVHPLCLRGSTEYRGMRQVLGPILLRTERTHACIPVCSVWVCVYVIAEPRWSTQLPPGLACWAPIQTWLIDFGVVSSNQLRDLGRVGLDCKLP